ncbi:hypothetical protein BURK2_01277 [Burkholderiales bacterium]|nr:MAG: hypothetical protein F9K47_04155 [Burkholderiales bacterium]CAG0970798.1 hypothetical protein BURK2_01277 [Burkholderiales bacterium]
MNVFLRLWQRLLGSGHPLASVRAAERWLAGLDRRDGFVLQTAVTRALLAFAATEGTPTPRELGALFRIDRAFEPLIGTMIEEYVDQCQRGGNLETRLWSAAYDLGQAYLKAYARCLRAARENINKPAWADWFPALLARQTRHLRTDLKLRQFRYAGWTAAQWRELHELYQLAALYDRQRTRQPLPGERRGSSVEEEYLGALLVARLNTGSFTPPQLEWLTRRLAEWGRGLVIQPPGEGAGAFEIDLLGFGGLRYYDARAKDHGGERYGRLDTMNLYRRIQDALVQQEAINGLPKGISSVEQHFLLARMAALFSPAPPPPVPRAERRNASQILRVVGGLPVICRAIAEVTRADRAALQAGAMHSYEEVTQLYVSGRTATGPRQESRLPSVMWRLLDSSQSGQRLGAPAGSPICRLGDLVAAQDVNDHAWTLGVVRRVQRSRAEETHYGLEVMARKLIRVMLQERDPVIDIFSPDMHGTQRPFYGLYLPAFPENRLPGQRSLVLPEARYKEGLDLNLITGTKRFVIHLTRLIEQETGWVWAAFSAVDKLD